MRFAAIFAALLLGVAAHPAEKRDICCCCNVHLNAVICQERTNCVCPGVMCPASASTIWRDPIPVKPTPAAAVKREPAPAAAAAAAADADDAGCEPRSDDGDEEPADEGDGFECCCCDASKPAIVCSNKASAADCICPAIACPTTAPTIYETSTPTPTQVPAPAATPDPEPCCCCNPGEGAIVCEMRSGGDLGCFCPMVMCPSGAPTVTVWPEDATATP